MKFNWNTTTPILSCTVRGCFPASTAELSNFIETLGSMKPKILPIGPFQRCLLPPCSGVHILLSCAVRFGTNRINHMGLCHIRCKRFHS